MKKNQRIRKPRKKRNSRKLWLENQRKKQESYKVYTTKKTRKTKYIAYTLLGGIAILVTYMLYYTYNAI